MLVRLANSLIFLSLILTAGACTTLSGQTRSGLPTQGRECASCHRMCEVAGERKDNPGAVERCKKSCEKKCKS